MTLTLLTCRVWRRPWVEFGNCPCPQMCWSSPRFSDWWRSRPSRPRLWDLYPGSPEIERKLYTQQATTYMYIFFKNRPMGPIAHLGNKFNQLAKSFAHVVDYKRKLNGPCNHLSPLYPRMQFVKFGWNWSCRKIV